MTDSPKTSVTRRHRGPARPGQKALGLVFFAPCLPTIGTQEVQKTEISLRGEDSRRRPGVIDLRAGQGRG